MRCESCKFPAGARTGEVRSVQMLACVGDWHRGDVYALCDDCLALGDPATFQVVV